MVKVTPSDIAFLGFSQALFPSLCETEEDFATLIQEIITEQSEILESRVGTDVYASTSAPTATYVKRAEKCLVAAELVQRRINIILGNSIGAGNEIDISHEGAQKRAYLDEAERLIAKTGADDYSGSVATSGRHKPHQRGDQCSTCRLP